MADMLAVKQGLLAIFRFYPDKARFQRLVIDNDKAVWVPVREAQVIKTTDARLHH